MVLVLPNTGEVIALEALLNKTAGQNLNLRLFTSNTTPAETDTLVTYTEATFTGYAAKLLTGASWTVAAGAPSEASYALQAFASTADQAAQSVYGYYVNQAVSTTLAWAERFTDGPYSISNNGDTINVTPKITAD